MAVKLNSTGGGSVTLDSPSTASNYTVTLPSAAGTLATTSGSLASPTITGTVAGGATYTSPTLTGASITAANSNTVEATSGPTSSQLAGNRNKIINGAMMIDQRNAGASVTPTDGQYTLDRWAFGISAASKLTTQQNSTTPTGFINSILVTSSSSYSISASDYFLLAQNVEGLNCSDLGWGTASAQTVTLSFWVRSSLTGTFGGALKNSAVNRSYPFTYTINSANTWEQKTITVAGDQSGTWLTTNGIGIRVQFGLGVGSTFSGTAGTWASANYASATGATSVVGTNGATFYITGVQLEKGATATPFENRLYGTELALCQRYFTTYGGTASYQRIGNGFTTSTTSAETIITSFPVQMRATPTLGYSAVSDWRVSYYNNSIVCTALTISQGSPQGCGVVQTVASGLTANYPVWMDSNNTTNARLTFSAEL